MVHVKSLLQDPPELPPLNIQTFLFDAQQVPDHLLYVDGISGRTRTREEFKARVAHARTAFGSSVEAGGVGLDSECMVAILSDNCLEYATVVLALCGLAVPFAPCSAYATPYELVHSLRLSKSSHIVVHSTLLDIALKAAMEAGISESKVYVLEGDVRRGFTGVDTLIQRAEQGTLQPIATRPVKRNQLAFVLFSSGTTGLPKAVALSHDNVIYCTLQAGVWLQTIQESANPLPVLPEGQIAKTLLYLPFYHTFGLHSGIFRLLIGQNIGIIMPRWNTDLALDLIPKYKINVLPSVPSIIHQLSTSQKLAKTDMSSVLMMSSGAAHLPGPLAEKIGRQLKQPVRLAQGYGLSECTISALNQISEGQLGGRWKANPGSTGGLIPGMEARTVRDDGSEADYEESGELWLKGKNVALGYYGNPKATAETFVDGWVRTGDQFKIDQEGYFYFQDRAKDTMKISGMQVSPTEIENAILSHPGGLVSDVAVAGVLPLRKGRTKEELSERVPRAWVVLTTEGQMLGPQKVEREVISWLNKRLSRYKQLRGGMEFVGEIPKTATGKVLRRQLVGQYSQDTIKPKL